MKLKIDVKDCRDCPYKKSNRSHGECWEYCDHPDRDENHRGYDSILWGCQDEFKKVPEWCPLTISPSGKLSNGKEVTELELSFLADHVANQVTHAFKFHYEDLKKQISVCKQDLERVSKENQSIHKGYDFPLSLIPKLQEIKEIFDSNSIGTQNVYKKFLELEQRQRELEELVKDKNDNK